jgi:hypothetical protein
MGVKLGVVVLAALALAAAAVAEPKPKPKNPAFRVTVTSTFFRHHVVHIASKPQANGCVLRTDADAVQQDVAKTQHAEVLTLQQLLRGVTPFTLLDAKETRGGTYTYGYNDGCPYLASTPRHVSDTSGCGTPRKFQVLSDFDAVGYLRGTRNFRFTYTKTGGDEFRGTCLAEVFVGEDENNPGAESVAIPPRPWAASKKPWWRPLDVAKLRGGKTVVVRFKSSGTFPGPPPADPTAYDQYVLTDTYSFSWTVTLTPVRHR